MSIREALKADFGIDVLIERGTGLRSDPYVLEACSATEATWTQLHLLRGLGRGRGELWRLINVEMGAASAASIQKLEIESVRFTPQEIITETRAYAVISRLPEAYQWLLVPVQATPQSPVQWQAYRLSGQESLAARASKKLRSEELLVPALAGTRLRMELDKIPLWRGDHVAVRQLVEDFARYVYLPRLRDPEVVLGAVRDGLGLLLWQHETFAYADGYDEASGRYRGLRCGQRVELIDQAGEGLLVKPEVALKQQDVDQAATSTSGTGAATVGTATSQEQTGGSGGVTANGGKPNVRPHRFHGTVTLDAARVGRDAGRIADEVIAHLSGLVGANVTVTLEIQAIVPDGVPDVAVRTVTENSRQLKFSSHGFEVE